MYDTGDFIDDYYVGHEEKNDQQLLFLVMVSREDKTCGDDSGGNLQVPGR